MELILSFFTLLAAACVAQILIDKNEIRRVRREEKTLSEMWGIWEADRASHRAKTVLHRKSRQGFPLPEVPRQTGVNDSIQAEKNSRLVLPGGKTFSWR